MARKKHKKRKFKLFLFFLFLIVVGFMVWNNLKSDNPIVKLPQTKKLNIIDLSSKERPYAVMINNHAQARINHAGLNDAYIVYEAIVEGGLTRLMAVYKDKNTERIGSVRSARHYFLDYALENDAIYVHFGWSPQAKGDIEILNVDNINGIYDDAFFRDKTLKVNYEHTAFTTMKDIKNISKSKNYRLESSKETLLNYSEKEITLDDKENVIPANSVVIPYSRYVVTSYKYNSDKKVYERYANDEEHVDAVTKEIYTAKNIIIMNIENSTMDSSGRQTLDNIGTGEGYYITNGSAVLITWTKSSRSSQTVYKYQNGKEIDVNDGNTYIQIAPIDAEIQIN